MRALTSRGPGEQFGPYRLDGVIGRGGMGEVYRAFDLARNRVVAVKRLPAHLGAAPDFRWRFQHEARIAARMRNPHVIPIHDYGDIDGQLFIDMRLVDGTDLRSRLDGDGPLPPEHAVRIVAQVASALDAAHDEGLVHRDVKPSNVLLTHGEDFVYLIDFGLARELAAGRVTSTGVAMGTLSYMAPERFDGAGDSRVDVYALACVLHETLTGNPPFAATDYPGLLAAHLNAPPPRPSRMLPGVPAGFDEVVVTGMHKDPRQRYQRAGELAAAAATALTGTPFPLADRSRGAHRAVAVGAAATRTNPPPAPPRVAPRARPGVPLPYGDAAPARPRRRLRYAIAGIVAVAALVTAAGVLVYLGVLGAGTPTPAPVAEPIVPPALQAPAVIARIDVGASPRNIAISADSSRVFATNREDNTISVVDPTTNAVVRTIELDTGDGPEGIGVHPDGRTVYVVHNGSSTVDAVSTVTGETRRTIPVDRGPTDVAVAPDGRSIYVTSPPDGSLDGFGPDSDPRPVIEGESPQSLALTRDSRTAYVTDYGAGMLLVVDLPGRRVTDRIRVGDGPDGVALSPDERAAYVVNIDDDMVSVVDFAARSTVATIGVGDRPISVAVHPDGRTAYVTNNESRSVSVIDTATREVVGELPVGDRPEAVAVAPDGRRVYVVNAGDGTMSVIDTGRP